MPKSGPPPLNRLRKQLEKAGVRPSKRLGQHFVTSPAVLQRILESASLTPDDVVVEIGAGLGGLTGPLAERVEKVYALEIDPRLARPLRDLFGENERVALIQADALQFDFASLPVGKGRKMKVVANLPYEISSPMIFRLLEERKRFSLFVLMLQAEVARRMVASAGTKDYGPLAIWVRLYTRARICFFVGPEAFYPRPKVDSAVVRFEVLERPSLEVEDEEILGRVIRSGFGHRRKTLANALRLGAFAHLSPSQIEKVLRLAGIDPGRRGESLSLEEFRDLARAFSAGT